MTVTAPVATTAPVVVPPPFAPAVAPATPSNGVPAAAAQTVAAPSNGAMVHLAPTLVAAIAPDAVAAEQYRALRTRVVHSDNGSPVHMLLVTSPGRGEGKSVTAANLALTMAQEYQQRICVVDANLRHPQLHRLFDIPEAPGLGDARADRLRFVETGHDDRELDAHRPIPYRIRLKTAWFARGS